MRSGNLQDIAACGSLHEFLMDLHKKHGPIASFYYGPNFTVSICTPEHFKQQLKVFDRPPALFQLFEPFLGKDSIQFANGERAKWRHAMYKRCLSDANVANFFSFMQKCANEIVTTWEHIPGREHVDLRRHMFNYTIRVVLRVLFGSYFEQDGRIDVLRQSYEFCWGEMESQIGGDVPDEGSARQVQFEKHRDAMHKCVLDAVADRIHNRAEITDHSTLFVDVLQDLDLTEGEKLDDMVSMLVGSIHTTGYSLTWSLYYLAANKDVQNKLYRELREKLGDEPVGKENVSSLTYLHQVIDETIRCSVVAPYAARFQDHDAEIGGHTIPAGTPVLHALGVALQNPTFYPDPTVFNPDRFSPENKASRPRLAFEPFGFAGKRVCPGYKLSQAESMVFIATVISKFEIDLVPGQNVGKKYGLVTSPDVDIWVTVSARE